MIKRESTLSVIGLMWLCSLNFEVYSTVRSAGKYNVLFIVADDLNCDIECMDDSLAVTPNLCRLCSEAMCFQNAYCQYPFSGPSRASFLTGYLPENIGVLDLVTELRSKKDNVVTLPQLYKNNGYFTARIGKVFHAGVPDDIGKPGMDDVVSWNETFNPCGVDKFMESQVINYTPKRKLGSALCFLKTEENGDEHTDAIGADYACSLIKRHKDKPFFIAVGFYRPHSPYIAPESYFNMYSENNVHLPFVPENDWDNRPMYARFTDPINWGIGEDSLNVVKQAYYASVTFLDKQVGKLLDTLEEEGLKDNTIVVFCGDNGYNLGQHGMWKKQALFEQSTRVPLIIYVPEVTKGRKSTDIVELLDLYPTLAEISELNNIPYDLEGKNRLPELKGMRREDNSAVSMVIRKANSSLKYMKKGEVVVGRSIRMGNYRYTEWADGDKGGELYNYADDPEEYINHYNDKAYNNIQKKLKKELYKRFKR